MLVVFCVVHVACRSLSNLSLILLLNFLDNRFSQTPANVIMQIFLQATATKEVAPQMFTISCFWTLVLVQPKGNTKSSFTVCVDCGKQNQNGRDVIFARVVLKPKFDLVSRVLQILNIIFGLFMTNSPGRTATTWFRAIKS